MRPGGNNQKHTYENINWYPGHIGRSYKQLQKLLPKIDLIVEILDARAVCTTTHPQISSYKTKIKCITVVNRIDMVTEKDLKLQKFEVMKSDQKNLYTNGKSGKGILELRKALITSAKETNIKKIQQNHKPRPIKCIVVGFPNVGKSAIINHLIGRRVCQTAEKPGLTRSYSWVRLSNELEILDGPGVLPKYLAKDSRSYLLAILGSIGDIAHENIHTASLLIDRLRGLPTTGQIAEQFRSRYQVKLENKLTSIEVIRSVSSLNMYHDEDMMAKKILKDFRNLKLGSVCIEI